MRPSFLCRVSDWLTVVAILSLLTCSAAAQSTSGRDRRPRSRPLGRANRRRDHYIDRPIHGCHASHQNQRKWRLHLCRSKAQHLHDHVRTIRVQENVQKDIIVNVNQVLTLNSTMQIGETQETVEVTSEAPQVDTTSTQLGAVINDRSVNELPLNTRDTYQFLQLQPGVQAQLGNGNGSLFWIAGHGIGFGERRTHSRQQFQREWRRCQRSVRELADHSADSGQRRGVPRHYAIRLTPSTAKFRFGGQCNHRSRDERLSWRCL